MEPQGDPVHRRFPLGPEVPHVGWLGRYSFKAAKSWWPSASSATSKLSPLGFTVRAPLRSGEVCQQKPSN